MNQYSQTLLCVLILGCSSNVDNLFGHRPDGGEGGTGGEMSVDGGEGGLMEGGASVGGSLAGGSSQGGAALGGGGQGGNGGAPPTCSVEAIDKFNYFHDIPCAHCLNDNCCELMLPCINDQTAGAECNANWGNVQGCLEQNLSGDCWATAPYPEARNWPPIVACKMEFCNSICND